jgi:beta-galactosidase GanA
MKIGINIFFVISSFFNFSAQSQGLPQLIKKGRSQQLMVHNKPFLILGGELGNSTASSMKYMQPASDKFSAMHLNTILAPVYWELMEPSEGKFDFALVDQLIAASAKKNLKLILLWFGSWKNSMSCYVPAWIKTNQARFPRAQDDSGKGLEILSAFNKNNLNADAKAFSALMKHIKETDKTQTVIMVQVENEIGMLTEARERTAEADWAFQSEVPMELINYLVAKKDSLVPELRAHWATNNYATTGNWETVFGKSAATEELFQAWYYAKFTNAVAEAGRKQYHLPMYVNAALNYRNVQPGQYPSAGPLPHLIDIWQAAAPAIDFVSPDFYNPYFKEYNDAYTRRGNTLFIPEIRFDQTVAAKAFYAIGHYHAIGFSPFSIESTNEAKNEPMGKSYEVLSQLSPEILKYQGTDRMEGMLLDTQTKKQEAILGDYKLFVAHDYTLGWSPGASKSDWPMTGAMIIQTSPDEFIVAGTGVVITFAVNGKEDVSAGILQVDEGTYNKGIWQPGRRMNGDQDHQGRHVRIPVGEWNIQRVKLYEYR